MNKIRIIDLLNKIANGNIPKRIIYDEYVYVWNNKIENYEREIDIHATLNWDYIAINCLNEPVEILEEEKKITPTDFENLGYALGSIQKYINKGYDKAIEEKKIPEKITMRAGIVGDINNKIENLDINQMAIEDKINEIIDFINKEEK